MVPVWLCWNVNTRFEWSQWVQPERSLLDLYYSHVCSTETYCVVCDRARLTSCGVFQGERSFFLRPGERLERGIQDVFVLSEEEGLVLRAVEAFVDTEPVRNTPP